MAFSRTGFVSVMFVFFMVSPFCVVEGRTRLLRNLRKEPKVGTHIVPSDQLLSGHSTDPGYNSFRKLLAVKATTAGKSASSMNDGLEDHASMDSLPAAASSGPSRRLSFHRQFVSEFTFFTFAKSSSTVSPSPGTPSPGHN